MLILSIWPTTVEGWVGLGLLFIALISTIVSLIPTVIALKRALKTADKNKVFSILTEVAKTAMITAQATGKSGTEKQEMVIATIKAKAKELNVEINEQDIEKLINSIKGLKQFFNDMKAVDAVAKK